MTPEINKTIFITPPGDIITQVSHNHFHIDFKNIKSIGLENIADIEHHLIHEIFGSRSHLIKFRNGGEVSFSYNNKGGLANFQSVGVNLIVGQGNKLFFSIKAIV